MPMVALAALVVETDHPYPVLDINETVLKAVAGRRHRRRYVPDHDLGELAVPVDQPSVIDRYGPHVGMICQHDKASSDERRAVQMTLTLIEQRAFDVHPRVQTGIERLRTFGRASFVGPVL